MLALGIESGDKPLTFMWKSGAVTSTPMLEELLSQLDGVSKLERWQGLCPLPRPLFQSRALRPAHLTSDLLAALRLS